MLLLDLKICGSWLRACLILIILIPLTCFAKSTQERQITYKIKYQDNSPPNCLAVEIELKGNKEGKHLVQFPNYAADVNFRSAQHVSHQKDNEENVFLFTTAPNDVLNFNYNLCVDNSTRKIEKPIIEADFFHFVAADMLLVPAAKDDKPYKIKIDFKALPEKFIPLSSFNFNQREVELSTSLTKFKKSLWVGTTDDIKKISIKDSPVYIISKGHWSTFDKDVTYYIEKLVTAQRQFWNDYDFPHYAIILIQQDAAADGKMLKGEHRENIITISFPDGPKNKLPQVLRVFSHELFHAWLGMKINSPQLLAKLQWFYEGLNDYYGLGFVLKSGLIDQKEYLAIYNKVLKSYYFSPVKNATNQEIAQYAHLKWPYAATAEMRGHIVFNQLNDKLPTNILGNTSLDEALKEVYAKFGPSNNNGLTEEELDKIFVKHLGKKKWLSTKHALISGDELTLVPELFSKQFSLVNKKFEAPNFGFDVPKFAKFNKIYNIKKSSKAYQAGLREGQKIVVGFVGYENPNTVAQIVISEKNAEKIIKFQPGKILKTVPQYEICEKTQINHARAN